jgi:hypothetical protein
LALSGQGDNGRGRPPEKEALAEAPAPIWDAELPGANLGPVQPVLGEHDVEHMWRLVEVVTEGPDAGSTYRCELCSAVLIVGPEGPAPETT